MRTDATGPKIWRCSVRVTSAAGTRHRRAVARKGTIPKASTRPTYLFADALERRLAVGEHRRLDEEALVPVGVPLLASGRERRALAHAGLDVGEDFVALLCRDERPEGSLLVEGLPEWEKDSASGTELTADKRALSD